MSVELRIQTRDPLVARDGRPFGSDAGNRMRSLSWILPSVTTGAVRTLIGKQCGGNFDTNLIAELKQTACHGPFFVGDNRLFLPAPADALQARDGKCVMLRPNRSCAGAVDLPEGLLPATLDANTPIEKFSPPPAWWSVDQLAQWLLLTKDPNTNFYSTAGKFLQAPEVDRRTHVAIKPETQASQEGMLFSTVALVLDRCRRSNVDDSIETELALRVQVGPNHQQILSGLNQFQTIGGERRIASVVADPQSALFTCPGSVKSMLDNCQVGSRLRLTLATPAIFTNGWLPGWVDPATMHGTPPPLAGTGFELVLNAVCNARWEAVSGWSYETKGPKAVRRMVPTGGTYYFTMTSLGNVVATTLADSLWLQPVSDCEQESRDGFGLATWGTWAPR